MLRKRQTDALEGILRGERFAWSILILDKVGQNIIAPLFRVSDLMEIGVVQCLKIESERPEVPTARAVYLVEESKENVEIIGRDAISKKYWSMEIIFTGVVEQELFESLAMRVAKSGECRRIQKIMDGLIQLSMLGNYMYTLNIKNSFMKTGSSATIENALLSLVREIDNPVIYTEKKYSMIIDELSEKVQKLGIKPKSMKKRSAIIVLGRENDLITPIEHGWTYSSLISDLLEYDLNKVTIPEKMVRTEKVAGVEQEKGAKVFDLNRFDAFWEKNQNEYFPTVAERIEQELGEYKADLAQRSIDSNSSKEVISQALSKVPELSQKNKVIHAHMTISLSLVEEIKRQKIDEIVAIENETKRISEIKDDLEDMLPNMNKDHFLRLIAVLIARFPGDRVYLEGLAKKKGCNLDVLRFIVQGSEESVQEGRSIVSTAATSLFRNIKKILPSKKKIYATTAVENILAGKETDYAKKNLFPSTCTLPYSSVHLFMIGGGAFTEYKMIMELAEEMQIEITYGSTEILSPSTFIHHIEHLQKRKKPN